MNKNLRYSERAFVFKMCLRFCQLKYSGDNKSVTFYLFRIRTDDDCKVKRPPLHLFSSRRIKLNLLLTSCKKMFIYSFCFCIAKLNVKIPSVHKLHVMVGGPVPKR